MNCRTRPYRMVARAASTAATADRILDAAIACFWERPAADLPLDAVAARAGVTVQTVIRRFGGRAGLFEAAARREAERIARDRDPTAVGSPEAAVRQLVRHYEAMGDVVLRLLAEAARSPGLGGIVRSGRDFHRGWCEAVFGDALAGLTDATRTRRLAQLVAVCDVQTWKLLRRDAGLSRRETEHALLELVTPLLEDSR